MNGQNGSASVFAVVAVVLVAAVSVSVAAVGAVFLRQRQASQAADLAALAAADSVRTDPAGACPAAEAQSAANGAQLVRCQLFGLDAQVATEVKVGPAGKGWRVSATARAGPPETR